MKNRRIALKSIAVASVAAPLLPERWSSPVVDAVILPSHGDTSPTNYGDTPPMNRLFAGEAVDVDPFVNNNSGVALACASLKHNACIEQVGGQFDVKIEFTAGAGGGGTHIATVAALNTVTALTQCGTASVFQITITATSVGQAEYLIEWPTTNCLGAEFTLPVSSSCVVAVCV